MIRLSGSRGYDTIPGYYNMYVTGIDNQNKITSLGSENSAVEFTTEYSRTLNAMSKPTVGVLLADTWIAKWDATYVKEDTPTESSTSEESDDMYIETWTNNNEVLNMFSNSFRQTVINQLNNHAEELRTSAIDEILEDTPASTFEVSASKYTIEDAWDDEDLVKEKIKSLVYGANADEDCREAVSNWWKAKKGYTSTNIICPLKTASNITLIYQEMLEGNINAHLKSHVNTRLLEYVNTENAEREEEATKSEAALKEKFKSQLSEEGKITYSQTITAGNYYANILGNSYSSRISSKYEKSETVTRSNDGEKFSEIFNNDEFYESKQAILERTEWFWEYVRENEDTAKLEDILRYLLNIATDSDSFGTYTKEDIENLFKAFEPKELKEATDSGMSLLKEYIRSWENSAMLAYINGESGYTSYVSKYISEDMTEYYVRDDGAGHPTVGFGVDIFKSGASTRIMEETGYSESDLRDTSGKVAISVTLIDEIEDEILESNYNYVKEQTSELKLTLYQKYALVSRAYNCGKSGAMDGYTGIDFVNAYTKYYNSEEDDKYGETLGDFENELYTHFMCKPTTSEGTELAGLVRRRKSEWTLFQTGYMDTIDKFCSSGNILEVCEEVAQELVLYGTRYSLSNLCWNDIAKSNDFSTGIGCCCATYVSVVLYRTGLLDEEFINSYNYNYAGTMYEGGVNGMMKGAEWIHVSEEEAEPGDVCCWAGHVFIYAGDNMIWDQNCGVDGGQGVVLPYWHSYIDQNNVDVWRCP